MVTICQGTPSDNQGLIFFLNALLGHSQILINFFRSLKITIFQANNSKTKKRNPEKYIAAFPLLIIVNVLYCFGESGISRNTDEFSILYSGLKNFPHAQVSVYSHEISRHSSLIFN